MSAASELRQAAATLRERAEAASPGPWRITDSEAAFDMPASGMAVLTKYDGIDAPAVALVCDEWYENDPGEPAPFNDAQWIATVHPGVGLALADWLDYEAGCSVYGAAPLAIARSINESAS